MATEKIRKQGKFKTSLFVGSMIAFFATSVLRLFFIVNDIENEPMVGQFTVIFPFIAGPAFGFYAGKYFYDITRKGKKVNPSSVQ